MCSKSSLKPALIVLASIPSAAWCQVPVVSQVVNAASYQTTSGSPGSIAAIFGTNLAATAEAAQTVPLPFQLGGTSVTVLGHAVPLFYVSPTQINFQVPEGGTSVVVVTTAAGSSFPSEPAEDTWPAAGIFTMDASGCRQGAVLDMAADGSLSFNSADGSASPGDWVSVYSTGITGIYTDGYAAPLAPLMGADIGPGTEFDLGAAAQPGIVGWAGLAPGFVGLDQINSQIPTAVREGCAVPLQVGYGDGVTQPVTIAVRIGGGPCVDPPTAGFGQITWQKTVSTTDSASESDTLTVSLQGSPGKQAPPVPVFTDICPLPSGVCTLDSGIPDTSTFFGPACPIPGYRSLGAGAVTMQGPGLSPARAPLVPLQQGPVSGLSVYQATLPSGTIQAGSFTVGASGGADVGAFQAPLQIGGDIQIQTPLEGANVWQGCQPFTINWTGGDPKSWVTVSFVYQQPIYEGGSQGTEGVYQTHTSNGSMTIPAFYFAGSCAEGSAPRELVIEVDPDPSEIATFSAPGLSLGGQAAWNYIHTFQVTLWLP